MPEEELVERLANKADEAIAPLLEDPVPRVRRYAAHALGCVACKPDWVGRLDDAVVDLLARMADHDPNAKVRAEAAQTLGCRPPGSGSRPEPR